jgi:hypothetical protein
MVDVFLRNLEEPSCMSSLEKEKLAALKKKSLFDFKELKCYCNAEQHRHRTLQK